MFQGSWNNTLPISYIAEARKRTRVIWLGNLTLPRGYFSIDILPEIFNITKTQTREWIISSPNDWIDFISGPCYCLNCEDDKSWMDVNGKKQKFLDWMATAKVRYDIKYAFQTARFSDNVIITVFDATKQKRLIVDGMNRAAALTICCETGISIPDVKVLECYGSKIDVLFPCDAHQL